MDRSLSEPNPSPKLSFRTPGVSLVEIKGRVAGVPGSVSVLIFEDKDVLQGPDDRIVGGRRHWRAVQRMLRRQNVSKYRVTYRVVP